MHPALILALVCFVVATPLAILAERTPAAAPRRQLYLAGFFGIMGFGLGAAIYAALSG